MDIKDFNPVVTPSDEEALKRGFVFDAAKADRPVRFIERLCRQSVGQFAGQPLKLLPWQKEWIWRTFGWIDPETGHRRHREMFGCVPKKQGKGELASALANYMLVADGEAAPKIAVAACDRKQAKQTFAAAVRMIDQSPYLSDKLVYSDFYAHIKSPENDGILEVNSSDADSPDGGNLSCVIIDELHRWTGSKRHAWNVYSGSGAARAQPLKIVISTAGEDRHSVMWEQYQRALKIESGEIIDVGFCGVVCGPREGEDYDPHSEEAWRKYNPSLGHTMSLSGFRADYEAAKGSPLSWNYWLRTRLGVWTQEATRFVDRDQWAACPARRDESEIGAEEIWFAGYDLASTDDLCAWVSLVGDRDKGIDIFCHAWMPEDSARHKQRTTGIPFLDWADQGYLTLLPGSRIDENAILDYADAEYARRKFASAYGDWYHAVTFGAGLEQRGIPYKVIRQGAVSLNAPTREFDRLLATGKVRHGGNPVLTWAASNAVTERDSNDNIRISRSKSHEKIDPMAALINAVAGLIDHQVTTAKAPPVLDHVQFAWKAYS